MWRELMRFNGVLTREELNKAYAAETGDGNAVYVESDEAYQKAIKDGWIVFEDDSTIIMEDGI